MAWTEQHIESWAEFLEAIEPFTRGTTSDYVFRGQANAAWKLTPSIVRELRRCEIVSKSAVQIERGTKEEFERAAHHHCAVADLQDVTTVLRWWSVMQHYGAPTRLLDWAKTPFVAAYFAIIEQLNSDGAIWIVDTELVQKAVDKLPGQRAPEYDKIETFLNTTNPSSWIRFARPAKPNQRVNVQQGLFSFCRHLLTDHDDALSSLAVESNRPALAKVVISKEIKLEFLRRLKLMGITASQLFPGPDGYARSVMEFTRLKAEASRQ